MDEKNAQTLKDVLKLLNDGRVTPEDLAKATKAVLKVVKELKDTLESTISSQGKELYAALSDAQRLVRDLQGTTDKKIGEIRQLSSGELNALGDFLTSELMRIEKSLGNIKEYDDSSLSEQIQALRDLIDDLPGDLASEDIRDRLELLQGDERLDVSAIKGLEERLSEIKTTAERPIAGGVIGRDLIKDYDLSSQLNGVTKTFALPATWNVISVHLSSFPHALRKTVDFTYTSQSITFTDQIDAATSLAAGQTCVLTIVSA